MFSQLDQQHGAFTPCRTRSASPFPSRVASASTYLPRPQPFFYSLPPSYAFAKVFLEVRTVRPPFPPLFDRAMKISLRLASKLRPSEPCRCSSLSLSVRGLLFYHLSLLVSFTKRGTYILVSCLLLAIDRGRITRPVVDPSIAREFSIQDSWFLSSIYSNRLIINSEKTRAWLH